MKILKASQLISSIIGSGESEIKIAAIQVNKLCAYMHNKHVCCELTLYDFEELSYMYPDAISMSSYEIIVKATPSFASSIRNLYRFDSDLFSDSEVLNFWKETNG